MSSFPAATSRVDKTKTKFVPKTKSRGAGGSSLTKRVAPIAGSHRTVTTNHTSVTLTTVPIINHHHHPNHSSSNSSNDNSSVFKATDSTTSLSNSARPVSTLLHSSIHSNPHTQSNNGIEKQNDSQTSVLNTLVTNQDKQTPPISQETHHSNVSIEFNLDSTATSLNNDTSKNNNKNTFISHGLTTLEKSLDQFEQSSTQNGSSVNTVQPLAANAIYSSHLKPPSSIIKPISKAISSSSIAIPSGSSIDMPNTHVNRVNGDQNISQPQDSTIAPSIETDSILAKTSRSLRQQPDLTSKLIEDDEGKFVYHIPSLTIEELITTKFDQGKVSKLSVMIREEQKLRKKRKMRGEPESLPEDLEKDALEQASQEVKATRLLYSRYSLVKIFKFDYYGLIIREQSGGPKLRIVDGKIQLDEESLFVNQASSELNASNMEVVDESIGRYITSSSFRKEPLSRFSWNAEFTAYFYQGLSYFGTDFSLITVFLNSRIKFLVDQQNQEEQKVDDQVHDTELSSIQYEFTNRNSGIETVSDSNINHLESKIKQKKPIFKQFILNRKQVKHKFNHEEKTRPDIITCALRNRKRPGSQVLEDMKDYVKLSNSIKSKNDSSINS